ncbi:DDE-type integrase/transposase/recombinase [Roseburia sp. MUC/MUC-530-WT-4D]|uniref:DDE-type integrase/transposase/recombinase n=1 Tax=Roseburia porci TaxID=2605790 RepID=A0A6L5YVZ1_9FIRM|nr:DDE-type integrase/transposase/recombinase [Roseburia porci]MCI7113132.1 DDE-type integrase/transposase/recombinase [Lachnobacterium sp.]MDD6155864.1 DDE-type integrase/transposase/recombinase [Lachnospiraceae bacterium]MST76102.1 DDE-type integrase/transposase/recombinase [Roseburia porci]
MDIIMYLIQYIQYQHKQICWLLNFICRYIPLRQWAFDDSHSPKYQKFKIDKLPKIISHKQEWNWCDLINYYEQRYHKTIKPVFRHGECNIPEDYRCLSCDAPFQYLSWNNGKKKTQLICKVCQSRFNPASDTRFSKTHTLHCPHCNHALVHKKDRKHFVVHKCVNPECPYYLHNLKKVDKNDLESNKYKYKLHYIYREFQIDFFRMDLNSLPKNASSLRFKKHDSYVMSLCLTYKVNLGLSLRKTAQALKDIHGITISHQQIANYCKTASVCIKPFVDNYDYDTGKVFTADETYIKIRGIKTYIWFIMDAAKRSIIGYQVSDNRGVGPCILAMRMAFRKLTELPKNFKFIADGYSAYPLAAQQFANEYGDKFKFDITQVIGLTNDDEVSKEYRPYKQMIERLNRTYKASYRKTNGFDNIDGANYDLALWVAYYNFLRPHRHNNYKVLNEVEMLSQADTMLGKWQLLIFLGQQTILNLQNAEGNNCS